MSKRIWHFILTAVIAALFSGCAVDKNSDEACIHQVTLDLDQGNYSAVLESPCADVMQKGGAYFERAGFRIRDVINTFSKTRSSQNTPGQSNLSLFLNTMIAGVSEFTLADLNSAKTEYLAVSPTDNAYQDAQFYIGLVEAVKGLSLLKSILDIAGDGSLVTSCDKNADNKPDSLDATSCALFISEGFPGCGAGISTIYDSFATSPTTTITFDAGHPGEYRGIIIQIDGSGTNISGCLDPNRYQRLLHSAASGTHPWAVVATAPGAPSCPGTDGRLWPCPLIQNGAPLELVAAVGDSLTDAAGFMSSGLTGSTGVQSSILNLRTDACPSEPCSASDVANYLQTYQ